MSEAIATRKRKLYKILDSFSCPPRITTGAGHPSPLIPSSRFINAPESVKAIANQGARQPRRVASLAKMAEYRARLGMGSPDKRDSGNTKLKRTTTILHKTGSSASLRGNKESEDQPADAMSAVNKRGVPAFCPWSHDEFLERLKTFAPVTTWLSKPHESVSEVAWAKRGWSCVGIETVACAACKARLVVDFSPPQQNREKKRRKVVVHDEITNTERSGSIPMLDAETTEDNDDDYDMHDADDNDYNYEEAFEASLVERYSALIIDGHNLTCSWRQLGCKDDIYHLPVVQRDWWYKHVVGSYHAALDMAPDIEKLNLRDIDADPPAATILRDLPETFFDKLTPPQPRHVEKSPSLQKLTSPQRVQLSDLRAVRSMDSLKGQPMPLSITISVAPEDNFVPNPLFTRALTIALTGWTPTTESTNNLLQCKACFQRVGLWLYHTSDKPTAQASADDDLDIDTPSSLDLINAHREHCPFRNAASQASTGTFANQPAWSILWQTLARYASDTRRRANVASELISPTNATFSPLRTATFSTTASGRDLEDIAREDRERSKKLKGLKKVFGIFRKAETAGGGR